MTQKSHQKPSANVLFCSHSGLVGSLVQCVKIQEHSLLPGIYPSNISVLRQDVCAQGIVWPSCSAALQDVFIHIFTYSHSVHKGNTVTKPRTPQFTPQSQCIFFPFLIESNISIRDAPWHWLPTGIGRFFIYLCLPTFTKLIGESLVRNSKIRLFFSNQKRHTWTNLPGWADLTTLLCGRCYWGKKAESLTLVFKNQGRGRTGPLEQ